MELDYMIAEFINIFVSFARFIFELYCKIFKVYQAFKSKKLFISSKISLILAFNTLALGRD